MMTEPQDTEPVTVDAVSDPVTLDMIVAAQQALEQEQAATRTRQEQLRATRNDLIRRGIATEAVRGAEVYRATGISEAHVSRLVQGRTSGKRRAQ